MVKVIWHKAPSPPYTDGSVVFTRWRQCAPRLIHGSLDPPDSASQTASRSVQPFLHSSRQTVPILYSTMGRHFPTLKIAASHGEIWTPSNTWFLAHSSPHPKQHLERICRFLQGSRSLQTDRQTDRPCYSVCNNRRHLHIVLRCGLRN